MSQRPCSKSGTFATSQLCAKTVSNKRHENGSDVRIAGVIRSMYHEVFAAIRVELAA